MRLQAATYDPGALYPRELTERPYSGARCPLERTIRTPMRMQEGQMMTMDGKMMEGGKAVEGDKGMMGHKGMEGMNK